MAMTRLPEVALAKFKDNGKVYLCKTGDVKEFAKDPPVSCRDFNGKHVYSVRWQEETESFDGYFSATIIGLAASVEEMKAKIKKNHWKEPSNLSSFGRSTSLMENIKKDDRKKQLRTQKVRERKQNTSATMTSSLQRMANVLFEKGKGQGRKGEEEKVKTGEDNDKNKSKASEEGKDTDTDKDAKCSNVTEPKSVKVPRISEVLTSGEDYDDDDDDVDVTELYFNLKKEHENIKTDLEKANEAYKALDAKHATCSGTIQAADSLRLKYQEELKKFKQESSKREDELISKLHEIAVKNVRLQLEIKALQKEEAPQPTIEASPNNDSFLCEPLPSCSTSNVTPKKSKRINEVTGKSPQKSLTDPSNNSFVKEALSVCNTSNTAKPKRIIEIAGKPLKRSLKDIEEETAKRVCQDLNNVKRLEERDNKVFLNDSDSINADMWLKKLRTASTDANFLNRFPYSLWSPSDLSKRCLMGKSRKPGVQACTPEKVAVIRGAYKGRLMSQGTSSEVIEIKLEGANDILSRKFTELSRPPRIVTSKPDKKGNNDKTNAAGTKD